MWSVACQAFLLLCRILAAILLSTLPVSVQIRHRMAFKNFLGLYPCWHDEWVFLFFFFFFPLPSLLLRPFPCPSAPPISAFLCSILPHTRLCPTKNGLRKLGSPVKGQFRYRQTPRYSANHFQYNFNAKWYIAISRCAFEHSTEALLMFQISYTGPLRRAGRTPTGESCGTANRFRILFCLPVGFQHLNFE
jgi:hypothetical protein